MIAYPQRCERHGCREPAHWRLDDDGSFACERHSTEALLGGVVVTGAVDGEPIALDELRRTA